MTDLKLLIALLLALWPQTSEPLCFEELSFDFGSRPKSEDVLVHEFVFTNNSRSAVSISYAVASCSCTRLSWTTSPLQPGANGVVRAEYHRERDRDAFEKFVSVFVEGSKKPYVLRIAGSFYETDEVLARDFPVQRGPLGFKSDVLELSTSHPGEVNKGQILVANLSGAAVSLSFSDLSDGLSMPASRIVIQPGSRRNVSYHIDVDSLVWGRRTYSFTPMADGEAYEPIRLSTMVLDNFKSLTSAERNSAALPVLQDGDRSLGTVRKGQSARASFEVLNKSDKILNIRAVYADVDGVAIESPASVGPGQTGTFSLDVPYSALEQGEGSVKVTVISDSPLKPVIDVVFKGKTR